MEDKLLIQKCNVTKKERLWYCLGEASALCNNIHLSRLSKNLLGVCVENQQLSYHLRNDTDEYYFL